MVVLATDVAPLDGSASSLVGSGWHWSRIRADRDNGGALQEEFNSPIPISLHPNILHSRCLEPEFPPERLFPTLRGVGVDT
jgi:hypothetical protein